MENYYPLFQILEILPRALPGNISGAAFTSSRGKLFQNNPLKFQYNPLLGLKYRADCLHSASRHCTTSREEKNRLN